MEVVTTDELWPKTLFEDDEERQPGLHLGEVTRSMLNRAGLGYKGAGFNDMELTAEIGLLWERGLSRIMADKYAFRPPQIQKDGIWMSPDGMGIGTDPLGIAPITVEEYKATWKSSRNQPEDVFGYMIQAKSYCLVMGTNVAVMRVFYIVGDYRGSGPVYRVSRILFTDKELEDNWAMVLREKDIYEKEGPCLECR
jgi:hypothetical protein